MADELDPITEQEVAAADQADVAAESVDEAEATQEIAAIEEAEVEQATDVEADVAETEEAAEEVGLSEEATADISDQPVIVTKTIPDFRAGDTLRLGLRIKEGEKTRTQYFEGIVLARKGAGVNKTFTIRKIGAGGIAVERIFPLYSPSVLSYEVRRRGVVRRAKVYFLRDIVGSTANVIKERKVVKEMQQVQEARSARKAVKVAKKAAKPVVVKKTKTATTTRSAKRATKKA